MSKNQPKNLSTDPPKLKSAQSKVSGSSGSGVSGKSLAPTLPKKVPTWTGFTDCKNLNSYNTRREQMNSLPPNTVETHSDLESLKQVREKITKYRTAIQKSDTTKNWKEKLSFAKSQEKKLEMSLVSYRKREEIKKKLLHWDAKWKKFRSDYEAGKFSEEQFRKETTEMAADLDKLDGILENIERKASSGKSLQRNRTF